MTGDGRSISFVSSLFDAYSRAARDISEIVQSWISDNWQQLVDPDFRENPRAFLNAAHEAESFWRSRNIFIADLLQHLNRDHLATLSDAASTVGPPDAVLKSAFLESLNIFLAVKVGYTIRVVFSTKDDSESFDVNCFPFLQQEKHQGIKCAGMRRIMQLAFADGSYAVDFEARDMIGVIGGCYQNNAPYVENDVHRTAKQEGCEFVTRTPNSDVDLGIASVAYFPVGAEEQETADAIIGVYSPIRGVFNESVSNASEMTGDLRTALVGFGAISRFADVLESAVKELMRGIVFQTVAQVVDASPYREAGIKTLSRMLKAASGKDSVLSAFDQEFRDLFADQLRSFIGHHGDTLLPFVRRVGDGELEQDTFDLTEWYREIAPKRAAQAFSTLKNFFDFTEDVPRRKVMVVGNSDALCAIFHAIIHNARERDARPREKPKLRISIRPPDAVLRYGVVQIQTPASYQHVPSGLSAAQSACVLRQGIPVPSAEGRGFGLFWSRNLLEACGGRLHVGRLRADGVLNSREKIDEIRKKIDQGEDVDRIIDTYRNGLEVAICLKPMSETR